MLVHVLLLAAYGSVLLQGYVLALQNTLAGLILSWGYPFESHWVTTTDGYMLQVFRLPRYRTNTGPAPRAVLLMHGLLDSSAAWVINSPNESLAFILHDAGYDVWLANVRGSTWGLAHARLPASSAEFWQFSWDEMALHDLPATLEHITNATSHDRVLYVGHSQGTTLALAALSRVDAVRRRVAGAVLLAPVAFVHETRSVMLHTLANLHTERLVERFGVRSFLPGEVDTSLVFSQVCTFLPAFCTAFIEDVVGKSHDLNATRLPTYLKFVPAGTSVMNMEHWAQGVRRPSDGTLRALDLGADCTAGHWPGLCNQRKYGPEFADAPPAYPLERIRTPLALLSGSDDLLSTPADVELLLEALRAGTVVNHTQFEGLSHLDFTWGMHTHTIVYPEVLASLAHM